MKTATLANHRSRIRHAYRKDTVYLPSAQEKRTIEDQRELSELGKEIAGDEIHWWVFKRESQLPDLKAKAKQALEHADLLKAETEQLKSLAANVQGYIDMLKLLSATLQKCSASVSGLEQYVGWLYQRDRLAPSILFTYRVWGSTRRSERMLRLMVASLEEEQTFVIDRLTEITLGLWSRDLYEFYRIANELAFEYHERQDPEDPTNYKIEETRLFPRLAFKVFSEAADHFRCPRDSLRNILLDIDKCTSQRNLLHSDKFWRSFILVASQSSKQECVHWDFKLTLEIWRTTGEEKRKAAVRLAELIAAFANAEGGVLLVGVSDDRKIVGLNTQSLENDIKSLHDALDRTLHYDRSIFTIHEVTVPTAAGTPLHCLIIIVAQSAQVVGVKDGDKFSYPLRLGTGLTRKSYEEIQSTKRRVSADNFVFVTNHLQPFADEANTEY